MISYEIENANDNGLDNSKIKSQIDELRSKNNFPKI